MNNILEELFTPREREVLQLITNGYSNQRIADELIISIHTVKSHKEKIFEKLNVHNSVEATRKYFDIKLSNFNNT